MDEQLQEVEHGTQSQTVKKKRSPFFFFVLGFLGIALVGFLGTYSIGKAAVGNLNRAPWAVSLAKSFRLPIAHVNGEKIFYNDFIENVQILEKFALLSGGIEDGSPILPEQEKQINEAVLAREMSNVLLAQLGETLAVSVTPEDLEEAKAQFLPEGKNMEDIEQELATTYGWTYEEFQERVIVPIVREQKIKETFLASDNPEFSSYMKEERRASHILFQVATSSEEGAVQKKAQSVLDRIKKGESFEKLAGAFGSDSTKETGGDLGWFTRGVMVPPFENVVFSLEPGTLAPDLVKTQFGYHIIQLTDKRETKDFVAFMNDVVRKSSIKVYADIENPFERIAETLNPEVVNSVTAEE